MRFMLSKYFNNLLMSKFIMGLVPFLQINIIFQLHLMQFLFHFLSSHKSFFQFLGHSFSDFLFSTQLFLWNLYNSVKIDLNSINKLKLLVNEFIILINAISVNG